MEKDLRPRISDKGKIFFITQAFPPVPAGSSIINRNLLSYFNPESYIVFSPKTNFKNKIDIPADMQIKHVMFSFEHVSTKIHNKLLYIQMHLAVLRILLSARKHKPVAIVTTYPDYCFLNIGYRVAKALKLPFIPYLHDTIAEALSGRALEKKAIQLQNEVFSKSNHIFVMSEGMSDLYKKKYNLTADPLPHTYMEPIRNTPPDYVYHQKKTFFWGGYVYGINKIAVKRISEYASKNDTSLFIASSHSKEDLSYHGISGDHIQAGFFAKRNDYLNAIQEADCLLLALNWPDESNIHEDELATIFPTKTPEYLASGKPIVVHCPEHYFLARFFKKYDCGIVITDRDPKHIESVLNTQLKDRELIKKQQANSLIAAKYFDQEKIAQHFRSVVNNI